MHIKSEPDNNQGQGPEGEDCAVVDSYTQSWYDVPCEFEYPRVCQKAASPLLWDPTPPLQYHHSAATVIDRLLKSLIIQL